MISFEYCYVLRGHIRHVTFLPAKAARPEDHPWMKRLRKNWEEQLKESIEVSKKQGFDLGFKEGFEEALNRFRENTERSRAFMKKTTEALQIQIQSVLRNVLRREETIKTEVIHDLLNDVIIRISPIFQISVHPKDQQLVQKILDEACVKKVPLLTHNKEHEIVFVVAQGEITVDLSEHFEKTIESIVSAIR